MTAVKQGAGVMILGDAGGRARGMRIGTPPTKDQE
jgi:hypothetical protein